VSTIRFHVSGTPVAKGRPRVFRANGVTRTVTPAKTVRAEESFLAQALPYKPETPLTGPLAVGIALHLPIPASWSRVKREQARAGLLLPAGRPDVDNLAKLAMDALNGVFWIDDAQIADLTVTKRYRDTPGTSVSITMLTGTKGEG
jgi:Holliday junction resolvase RusA-like endonuclease